MAISHLTIFGAGLIGGSIALAARQAGWGGPIVAIDREPQEPQEPREQGSLEVAPFDHWILADDSVGVQAALAQTSLCVLCTPVGSIMRLLPTVLDHCPGWVTDCGSTKQAVLEAVAQHSKRAHFVAGHPMAGHPQGGLKNARAELFRNRKWILCPEGSHLAAVTEVRSFVSSLGAEVVELSAQLHDKSVAHTSHLPQVVASALSVQAAEKDALQAAGPGFASTTRVAGGAESMWRDIFETNGVAIGQAMQDLGTTLLKLGRSLEHEGPRTTLEILGRARALRDDG